MIIKEREFSTCPSCQSRKLLSDEQHGCDVCKSPIAMDGDVLSATVHSNEEPANDLHFCSWVCALKGLADVKTDYFISLPFLSFDAGNGCAAKDFFTAIKTLNAPERDAETGATG